MNFAAHLRAERLRLGLTQTDLAQILGVSLEAISKWERGLVEPAAIAQEGARARLARRSSRGPDPAAPGA